MIINKLSMQVSRGKFDKNIKDINNDMKVIDTLIEDHL